ncbi:predicted protein [Postia placenta Mad-698-R]|uniref:Uncharacterized protein n=1 Tax=Postia placenta MAD-698-R-SB12 TaxID=670580 RepID=A0A1X6MT35_9APHY|nr:hypothetical protein POSPLADRAFT_1035679 [Postia placenta MAD-698-R-SB12]EED77771.1 predicted protein [Postia placenta Mad-698-R]EED82662.1 predicted protein [Postia placenta Mad-698-R]OSX59382.1 hypothetical protein POSPLADRAFT_1035679 [Postia placenta MAD-698-R-SB12]
MPLVRRYQTGSHFAEMLSTAPSNRTDRRWRNVDWSSAAQGTISGEVFAWIDAIHSFVNDLKFALQRARAIPNYTQKRTFAYLAPLYVYVILFGAAVVALHPRSYIHRVLTSPYEHASEARQYLVGLVLSLVVGLLILRLVIWFAAELVDVILENEDQPVRISSIDTDERDELRNDSARNLWLGGILD